MKKFFVALFALCIFALTVNAQHFQKYNEIAPVTTTWGSSLNGGTNWVVGVDSITTVSNYPPISAYLDCPKSENMLLYISYKCAAGTTNSAGSLFTFYRAAGRGLICSNSPITMTLYPQNGGAATNRFCTNIVMNGLPYLYMAPIGNSNMYAMTNIYVGVGFKN